MRRSDPGAPVTRLVAAACTVAAEAVVLLMVAASVVASGTSERVVMDLTTTVFFVAYAAGLLACAWGLWRRRRWARAPVVFAQLVQVGVAWSFASGSTVPVAVLLAATALVVLVLVLSPASTRALQRDAAD